MNIDFANANNTAQLLEILKHIDETSKISTASTVAKKNGNGGSGASRTRTATSGLAAAAESLSRR